MDDGSPQNVLDLIHEHAGEDLLIVGAGGVGKTTALVKILQEEYGDENGYDENTTVPIYVELNNAPEKIHELVDLKNHDGSAFILCYIASANFNNTLINGNNFFPSGHTSAIMDIQFNPTKNEFLSADTSGKVCIWDTKRYLLKTKINANLNNYYSEPCKSVPTYSASGSYLALTMNKSHYAIILSLTTPEDPKTICDTKSFIKYAEYSQDGKYIITVSNDHWTLWDAANLTSIGSRYGHYDSIISATFNRNDSKVISTSYDRNAVVYNIPDLSFAGCLYGHHNGLITAKYDSLGQSIIAAARDEIIIYNLQTQKVSLTIGDLCGITSADFNSIRNIIAFASEDKCVKIHDCLCGKLIMTLNGHAGSINHVEFSEAGERLLTVSDDSVILWETETGKMTMRLHPHFPAHSASFISDSKFIVVTGENHQLCICDIYANRDLCQNTFIDLNSVCNSCGFESILWREIERMTYIAVNDGKNQIAASAGFDIVLYDIFEKETQVLPQMHCSVVTALSYSPDGRKLASADVSGNIIVWHDNRLALTMESHSSRINSICFSPDGSSILAASDDGAIITWDISGYMHSSIAIDGSRVIKHTSGLIVLDCDFRNLHPDSKLSEEDKATLRQYGAILD